ncbi:AP endonuclease [Desulfuromonas versatilis]|uniref:AP endonuclease n=1 Tax=Desulfuromonas versatilis TaxID=2802975 RepID=A0ABN6DRU6_9BACT|nr:sugar phosphate isomerase/epimerase family protein [Desulfuromonas versatilis]BCR02960.1 AP endonuclease [Desulfuromonas versatilis]
MADRLHVHVPYRLLGESLPLLLERRLQPEIAFSGDDLDRLSLVELRSRARVLRQAGLGCTVHAPFHDLNPGTNDPLIRQATLVRCTQTLNAAAELGASLVVFHPGYEKWRYSLQSDLWLAPSLKFWPPLIQAAERLGLRLALENIFEEQPDTLAQLLTALGSPTLGHCLDVGHWRLFAKVSLKHWLAILGPHLVHLHLHDNLGDRDAHLPVGEGSIDFPLLFRLLKQLPVAPTLTLESHDRQSLLRSLAGVAPFLD